MLRVVVAYLMIVMAAGPWLCCCTATRLTARLLSPAGQSARLPVVPCCQSSKADEGQPASTSQSSCPQAPATPDCPCKQGSSNEVAALPIGGDEFGGTSDRLAAGAWLLAPCQHAHLVPEVASPAGADGISLPFLSTHDLLHILHIMRC
jgi:hypothetical protein